MKKLYILLAFLLFGAGLRAQQTDLTEAVDFTVTDCHGQTYNLFEILDRGQAVFIDFFFYTCNQCQVISPYITGSYPLMGCNMHDVFYMEISYIDNDAMCQRWEEEHGVEFPTIGKDGGGNEVFDLYGIIGCPTWPTAPRLQRRHRRKRLDIVFVPQSCQRKCDPCRRKPRRSDPLQHYGPKGRCLLHKRVAVGHFNRQVP